MFARVTKAELAPQGLEKAMQDIKERILARELSMKGFKGLMLLGDRSSGIQLALVLWETEDDMLASEVAAESLRGHIAATEHEQFLSLERFEVFADTRI